MANKPDEQAIADANAFDVDQQLKDLGYDGRKLDDRTVALFTGQFADYWKTVPEMARAMKDWGYDAIGAVTWGPMGIDPVKALGKDGEEYLSHYVKALHAEGIGISTLADHLATQAIAAAIIDRPLLRIMPADVMESMTIPEVIGSATLQERVRVNAALHLMNTARAVTRLKEVAKGVVGQGIQQKLYNPTVIPGFIGSQTFHLLHGFPPVNPDEIERGYQEVAYRMARALDVLAENGLKYALETHPGEQAIDLVTAKRLAKTINKPNFGYNGDSSHSVGRGWNYIKYLKGIANLLFSTHLKGAAEQGDGSAAVYSDPGFGDVRKSWDFRSIGRNTKNDAGIIYTLEEIGYKGPAEIEWEDARLNKEVGARASLLVVKGIIKGDEAMVRQGLEMYKNPANYEKSAFDAAFAARK